MRKGALRLGICSLLPGTHDEEDAKRKTPGTLGKHSARSQKAKEARLPSREARLFLCLKASFCRLKARRFAFRRQA